jgi:two-component system response regulator AtoC
MFEIEGYRSVEVLIGDSPAIHRICAQLQKAALTDVPVLITGESGTGKGLAARLLHNLSPRRAHNFLKVSCAAMPNQLFESELFGHEPSVFTAKEPNAGKCVQDNKGTLFLDEIGELDLGLQAKFLHALQHFRVVRLGTVDERAIDSRLICATNRDIEVEVVKGGFRTDLFYRINVLRIHMPALRERASDVPILMNHFIRMYRKQFGGKAAQLSSPLMRLLESYHWPGNVRELENMAKRYVVLGEEEHMLSVMQEPEETFSSAPDVIDLTTPLRVQTKRATQHLERKIILGVLEAHKWNRRLTARSLDISYRALLYKIKEVGLPVIPCSKPTLQKLSLHGPREVFGIDDFR